MKEHRKVLILTADAGLGHRSAAEAVASALKQRFGASCDVNVVNVLTAEGVPSILREAQLDYDRIVSEVPELYRLGYEIGDAPVMTTALQNILAATLSDPMDDVLDHYAPDVIVSTYPLYQGVMDQKRSQTPYVTVITDLTTIHNVWFTPSIDLCIVPTEAARQQAIDAGVPAEHVEVIGIPVDSTLGEREDPATVRSRLGWRPGLTTILAVGGKRVGNLYDVLHVLNHSGFPLQFALVAGKNEELHRRFQETNWHLPAHIYGFVDNMPELMHASDAILCKAGGLIVSESLAAGLPLLLVDVLPGQETGNAEFVIEGQAGALAEDPLNALETIAHWLQDDGTLLAELAHNAGEVGTPHAALDIADRVWTLADPPEDESEQD